MSTKKIFLDFDDTLFFTKPAIFQYVEDTYGVTINQTKWHCGNSLPEIINAYAGEELVEVDSFWRNYARDFLMSVEKHQTVQPLPDMVEVINELSEIYELYIVTARQKVGIKVIDHLVTKHIDGCIKHIHCVWDTDGSTYKPTYKHEYVGQHLGEKIAFIDDHPQEVEKMSPVAPSFLFDPNGLHPDHLGEKFVSWKEIGNRFL